MMFANIVSKYKPTNQQVILEKVERPSHINIVKAFDVPSKSKILKLHKFRAIDNL